jgi:hypothetical protein
MLIQFQCGSAINLEFFCSNPLSFFQAMPEHQKQHLTPANGAEGGGAEGAVQLYRPPNMMAGAIPSSGGIHIKYTWVTPYSLKPKSSHLLLGNLKRHFEPLLELLEPCKDCDTKLTCVDCG